MKRYILYLLYLLILLCFLLALSKHRVTYRLLNEEEQICSISIVSIRFDEVGNMNQTEIQKIEDTDAFLDDFRKVDCYINFGDPTGVTEERAGAIVIKVLYENGEYELINWNGQAEYTLKWGFKFHKGFNFFEQKQFETLMNQYLSKE